MLRLVFLALSVWVSTVGTGDAARQASQAALKVGDPAPPFSLVGSDGRTYSLADYTGRQVVVLAWFAKAFTSG